MTDSRRVSILPLLLAGLMLAGADRAPGAEAQGGPKVVATVAGTPITQAEVERELADALRQLDQRRQGLMAQAVQAAINNRLLELEAAAQKLSTADLVAREVTAKVVAPTDSEVDAFYEANKGQIRAAKEQVAPQIRQRLQQQRQAEVGERYVATLAAKYEVRNFLAEEQAAAEAARAAETRQALQALAGPSAGPAQAKVTLVEFSDFQCPYCSRLVPTIEQVKKDFAGEVRVVFLQFPIPQLHADAEKAAEASLCADEQGKFWEMHDAMFADQRNLGVPALKEKAAKLGLDGAAFGQCLDSGKHRAKVQADVAAGQRAGVSGTPVTFVNGRMVSGAAPYDQLAALIREELARSGASSN
jgi:protein-disulfide isomerase